MPSNVPGQYTLVPIRRRVSDKKFMRRVNKLCLALTTIYQQNNPQQIAKVEPFTEMDME